MYQHTHEYRSADFFRKMTNQAQESKGIKPLVVEMGGMHGFPEWYKAGYVPHTSFNKIESNAMSRFNTFTALEDMTLF